MVCVSQRIHRFSALRTEPWRNGRGVTRTIATGAVLGGEPASWRLSLADIGASGPFSNFDGYDRTIVSIEGPEAALDIDGVRTSLVRHWPLRFIGEAVVSAEIDGPTRDVNVMVRRDAAAATVWVERTGSTLLRVPLGSVQFAFVLEGDLRIVGSAPDILHRFDCLHLDDGTSCDVLGPALLLRVVISPNH